MQTAQLLPQTAPKPTVAPVKLPQKDEVNITEFRLLWWDLADLTESKVSSWMQTAFSGCHTRLKPSHEEVKYTCPKCHQTVKLTITQLAGNGLSCCNQPITLADPQLQAFLDEDLTCSCGTPKIRNPYAAKQVNWKTRDYITALKLYHIAGAWRNKWFNYTLGSLVFYDQRSVRVVPVDHSKDVEIVLEQAKQELITVVLPLDTLGAFGKWTRPKADIGALWEASIKFPRFTATDDQAKRAVLDTVKNSILGFIEETNDKVLTKLNTGKVNKRTVEALLRKLDELKKRDVWGVAEEPDVKFELEALEGLLEAQTEAA